MQYALFIPHLNSLLSELFLYLDHYGKPLTKEGELCIIPWKYNGQQHEGCANPDSSSGGVWCPTQINADGEYEVGSGHRGYCSEMTKTRECIQEADGKLFASNPQTIF